MTTSAVPGHCIDIDGNWWHEPGLCEGARMNCRGDCCQAPTKWVWVRCHDLLWHAFEIEDTDQSGCGDQWIDADILRSASRNGDARTTVIPFAICKGCRSYVYDDFIRAGLDE